MLELLTGAAVGWWVAGLSALSFVGSLLLLPFVIVRMPADYFHPDRSHVHWRDRHPAVRLTLLVLKNIVGMVLVLVGLIMLFTPGQGILSVLLGLSLLDVPGKRALELRIIGKPSVLRTVNAVRARWGRPALDIPETR